MSDLNPPRARGDVLQMLNLKGYAKASVSGTAADITVTGMNVGYLVSDVAVNFIYDDTAVAGDDAYLPANQMLPLALANKTTTISVVASDGSSTGVAYFVELQ